MAFTKMLFAFLASMVLVAFAKDGTVLQDITCFSVDPANVIELSWDTIYEGISAAWQSSSPLITATYSMSQTTLNTFNYTNPSFASDTEIFAAVVFVNEPNCQQSEVTLTPDRLSASFMDLVAADDCSIAGGYGSNGCAGPNPSNENMPQYWNFMVEKGW